MDQLTRDLLINWGLCEYVDKFRDGRVDSGTLRILGEDEISQLINIPGDRARFKANLRNWQEELSSLNEDRTQRTDSLLGDTTLGAIIRQAYDVQNESSEYNYQALETPRERFLREDYSPASSCNSDQIQGCSTPNNVSTKSNSALSPATISIKKHSTTKSSTVNTSQCDAPASTHTNNHSTSKSSLTNLIDWSDISALPSTSSLREDAPDSAAQQPAEGYVLKTLSSSFEGRAILAQRKNGKLSESLRNVMVKLILTPLFERDPKTNITNKELLTWSLEIQQLFEKECCALYYTPYVAPLVHTTARNASGKLLRFVYNKRRQLRERGIIQASPRSSSTSSTSTSTINVSPAISLQDAGAEAEEEILEKLNWLKNSLEPWHIVQEYWTLTCNYRISQNYRTSGTVQEYFDEYPVLKRPASYLLLVEDFKNLHPGKCDAFFTNIVVLREKIILLAKEKVKHTRDKDMKRSIDNYLISIAGNANPEVANNGALLLLPYVASSVPLKNRKKQWRPSKSEIRDGFITQLGSDTDLVTTINSRREKLKTYGKTLQPFVVFIGESIASISHCFVVVADTYYKIDTLSLAVDTCFKIIHATGAKYQDESFVIWMIIQKAFYDIVTPYDKELTTVKSLLIDLGL